MKKYIIVFSLSLLALTAAAQKKKKRPVQEKKIEKIIEVPKVIEQPKTASSTDLGVISMPQRANDHIQITRINGEELYLENLEELKNTDLSQLKKLTIGTTMRGRQLDSNLIQQIMEAGTRLEELEIGSFSITAFPELKTANHSLKKLKLVKNELRALPSSIGQLNGLEEFNCSNPLTELPESFGQLKNLRKLSLNYITFSSFPKVIFNLNQLAELHVSGSYKENAKITVLPDLFQQLPNLIELGITDASLSMLPPSIASLKKLEDVDLSNNKFSSYPGALAANPKLIKVAFIKNPLQWKPFLASIKKIKWRGLFFLNDTGLTQKQYEQVQQVLSKTDVYYDEVEG